MDRMIFVNLAVTDLPRSIAFYEAVGAVKNETFGDPTAMMMSFTPAINVMLLTHDRFRTFSPRPIPDTQATSAVLLCLSADGRTEVDSLVDRAVAGGGAPDPTPKQEHGTSMYGRSFTDPDGHIWEIMWMDDDVAGQSAEAEERVHG